MRTRLGANVATERPRRRGVRPTTLAVREVGRDRRPGDGRSALELIECWPAPDVILLDRMLPFVDGDELLRRIRAEPSWAHVPIVVVSAKAREEEIAQAMAAGANEYITKPFSPMHVMKVLERYLPSE